ncbi:MULTISPECIES: hypothetical protein [unclassified Kitasatospora]|uniref:hypothetical protein n=1 Tax=unclassified Kitasatospora TaxID=2633591 RepID=UPI0034067C4A
MTPFRRRPSAARVLFALYAVVLVALAVWQALQPWNDPFDSSAALPALAFVLAAPGAVIPLVASGIGGMVSAPVFNALAIVVALAEAALLHRAVRSHRSKAAASSDTARRADPAA